MPTKSSQVFHSFILVLVLVLPVLDVYVMETGHLQFHPHRESHFNLVWSEQGQNNDELINQIQVFSFTDFGVLWLEYAGLKKIDS